jgi:hypothetical protein
MKFGRLMALAAMAVALCSVTARAAEEGSKDPSKEPLIPWSAPEPVFPEGPSPECIAADASIQERLEPVLAQKVAMSLPAGEIISSVQRARMLCRTGHPDRGMMLYIRISDALADALKRGSTLRAASK